MVANFSSAAITALGLSNSNAVPKVSAKDLVRKERLRGSADMSMAFDGRGRGAVATTDDEKNVFGPDGTLAGTFGMMSASQAYRSTIAAPMEKDVHFVDNTIIHLLCSTPEAKIEERGEEKNYS